MDPNLFTSWHGIIIMLLPGLIALICKPDWTPTAKLIVAIVVSFLGAVGELLLTGTCTLANLPVMLPQALALVFGSYNLIWKRFDFIGLVENKGNV